MMRQLMKASKTVLYSLELDPFNSSTISLKRYRSQLQLNAFVKSSCLQILNY